jgi:hypothetical protein
MSVITVFVISYIADLIPAPAIRSTCLGTMRCLACSSAFLARSAICGVAAQAWREGEG